MPPKTYTCGGQTLTATEWAKELGISRDAFCQRLTDFENPELIFMLGYLRKPRRKNQFHGYSGTATHNTWTSMLRRCTVPEHRKWPSYGGRGIKVCKRWFKFENFLADMGERPKGTTLDRYPNNDGDYEKANCRWATPSEQGCNTSVTVFLLVKGKRLSLQEAAKVFGVTKGCLCQRLYRQRRGENQYGLVEISRRK